MESPPEKVCRECWESKPLEAFPLQKMGRLGRHPLCRTCRAAQERERYWRDLEAILERSRLDPKRKRRVRWRPLQRKYGTSEHEHRSLVVAQRGRCAICERRLARVVDRDHRTGHVRGLVCTNCNFGVAALDDDPQRCEVAADYLERRT